MLELVETPPEIRGDVITPTEIAPYEARISEEAKRVEIRGPDGEGFSLQIEEHAAGSYI